jgi:hypothetical protein
MSFLANLQLRGRLFPRQERFCLGEFRPVGAFGTHLRELRVERLCTGRSRQRPAPRARRQAARQNGSEHSAARPCIRPAHRKVVSPPGACPRAFRAREYPRNRRHFCPGDRPLHAVPPAPDPFSLAQTRVGQIRGFFRRNAVAVLSRSMVPFFNALREFLHRRIRRSNVSASRRPNCPCPLGHRLMILADPGSGWRRPSTGAIPTQCVPQDKRGVPSCLHHSHLQRGEYDQSPRALWLPVRCVCRLRRGTLRPRPATKDQGSSCLSNPQRLDAGPEWEDNTAWSGTSKQVRTRKPFEP